MEFPRLEDIKSEEMHNHVLHELLHQHHLHSNTGQSLGVLCMYIAHLFNIYSPIS